MKKYAALLLMVASLAGLAWAGVLALRMALAPAPALSAPRVASLPTKDGEDAQQQLRRINLVLSRIESLKRQLPLMAMAPLAQAAPAPLAALDKTTGPGAKQASARMGTAAAPPAPVISMVYLSSDMRRAVIDGKLYAIGDALPGGGNLMVISLNEVVIDVKGRRTVVQVPRSRVSGSTVKPVAENRSSP